MKTIIKPKFVKRANMWLVSISKIVKKDKQGQEFHWFHTEQDALDFIKSKEKND